MVTRKVARSKGDAIALAEAQLHESGSEAEIEKQPSKPMGRRAAQVVSAARAREAKAAAKADEAQSASAGREETMQAGAAAKNKRRMAVETGGGDAGGIATTANAVVGARSELPAEKDTATRPAPIPVAVAVSVPVPQAPLSAAITPRSISTRNGGSRRVSSTSVVADKKNGISQMDMFREELERKLEFVDPAIKARFGELVWARRAAFPFWPALILDPRLLPEHQLPNALKELDEKFWVQLYGSRDIRQILFSALAPWEDETHPYRDGFPKTDFHRLAKLKDTFAVALNEASDQENLAAEERLRIFKTEVVPSLGLPIPAPLPGIRKRRKIAKVSKPDTPSSHANGTVMVSTAVASGTMPSILANDAPATSTSLGLKGRTQYSAFVTQEPHSSEPESRYRLGQLPAYVTRLRAVIGKESADRNWRVQLLLSQLLDEKAFLREDLENAGVWEVMELVRSSENERWRSLEETVSLHLKNCILEEWPSTQRAPELDTRAPKRRASAPLLPDVNAEFAENGQRTGDSPSRGGDSTDSRIGSGRSTVEAMAEAVARGMISRTSIQSAPAFIAVSRAPVSGSAVGTSTRDSSPSPFLSSASAMLSVGISPRQPDAVVGSSLYAPANASSTHLPFAQAASLENSIDPPTLSNTTASVGSSASQQFTSSTPLAGPGPGIESVARTPTASTRAKKRPTSARAFGPSMPVVTPAIPASQSQTFLPGHPVARSNPSLVIFNKDGTLLDFQTTWTSWIESQAWRLETALGRPIREAFFDALGYNAHTRTMRKGSVFNTSLKHELGPKFAVNFLKNQGLQPVEAVRFVSQHWSLPREVATFRPRRDLPSLFKTIRELGVKIAIATTDRRDVTAKTLTHLGVGHLVDLVSCGDDGITNSAERIWAICSRLGVYTANTVMVGDTADDMALARSAGCALAVGVLGGAADLSDLCAEADFLVPCVTNVVKLLYQYRQQAMMANGP